MREGSFPLNLKGPKSSSSINRNLSNLESRVSALIRSDEGLMLKTPYFQFLYGGYFTISTQLINPLICANANGFFVHCSCLLYACIVEQVNLKHKYNI